MSLFAKRSTVRAASSQRKTYILDRFEQLPNELRERVLGAGITASEAQTRLPIVLNILHFKTKQNFYTPQQYHDPARKAVRRHNRGPSLVDAAIVSTAPLTLERNTLLAPAAVTSTYTGMAQVGKGGFGTVLRAHSSLDESLVAIKKMPHESVKQKRKNYQEIRFLKYLNGHENIVRFIRASLSESEIWLCTEYIDGGSLSQLVSVHRLSEAEIAYVCYEVLVGIAHLHARQLAHRDLKSANIMLTQEGALKIIDFGLCSDMSQGEVVHMVGSPFWMPPEMIRKEYHGLPVDIWSFGICMMELANGAPPNRKSSIKAMFTAAVEGYATPLAEPSRWSPAFADFLSHCVRLRPEDRWSATQLLAHEFLTKRCPRTHMADLIRRLFGGTRG